MPLDIVNEVEKLNQMYKEDPHKKYIRALVTGESGSGKTFLMRSAPLPLHVDSFDPGGGSIFEDMIDKGQAVVDSRYESEDRTKPEMYSLWKTEFDYRFSRGYFDYFSTYVLDSSTTWAEAIMNWRLKAQGIAGEAPRFTKDYTPQKIEIRNYIRKIMNLPCNVFLTGHLKAFEIKEGDYSYIEYRYLTTGDGTTLIPLLFDELWVMEPKQVSSGVQYRILTTSTGKFLARSRLAKDGLLSQYEEPNIKKLLAKAKKPMQDKTNLKELKNVPSDTNVQSSNPTV